MELKINFPKTKANRDILIADLKKISIDLGKDRLSFDDIKINASYSITTYRNYFGSIRNALLEAGLKPTRNWGTSKEDYLENIIVVWSKLGKQPRMEDMNLPISEHSSSSYRHYFGSWTEALVELEKFTSKETQIEEIILSKQPIGVHKTKRNINLRLRFLVMKRDNFKCCNCGRSPSTTPGLELHIDHIKPWSKGGETTIDNLQTLCSDCNLGKSNLE